MFRHGVREIAGPGVGRQIRRQGDTRGRQAAVVHRCAAGRPHGGNLLAPVRDLHDLDRDRALGAGAHARGSLAHGEPAVTHVALSDYAAFGVVLRHAVRTVPGAVLAADARIGAVTYQAGQRILRVRIDRTTGQAGGLEAVVAPHRQVRLRGVRVPAALNLADATPVDRRGVAVLLVAGDDAALAADALPHVEVEAI